MSGDPGDDPLPSPTINATLWMRLLETPVTYRQRMVVLKGFSGEIPRWIFGVLALGFVLAEIPFTGAWLQEQGGLWEINAHFWHQIFHDPLYQVTAIDYTTVAILVYGWMLKDAHQREQHYLPWVWFVPFLVSPALGLLGYLLTRPPRHEPI